jgi:hypothetical protein
MDDTARGAGAQHLPVQDGGLELRRTTAVAIPTSWAGHTSLSSRSPTWRIRFAGTAASITRRSKKALDGFTASIIWRYPCNRRSLVVGVKASLRSLLDYCVKIITM